jgi:hypothetical protein
MIKIEWDRRYNGEKVPLGTMRGAIRSGRVAAGNVGDGVFDTLPRGKTVEVQFILYPHGKPRYVIQAIARWEPPCSYHPEWHVTAHFTPHRAPF